MSGSFLFAPATRRAGSVAAVIVGVALVMGSRSVPDGPDWYLAALILAAAPFATCGLILVPQVIARGPIGYRPFWRCWFAAAATAYAAGAVALVGVVTHTSVPLAIAALLLVAAIPLWCAASLQMLRVRAGGRAVSVDVLDALIALVLFGTPAVLVFAGPLAAADHPAFVAPFVASVVLVPAGVYLSIHNLVLAPRGDRVTQAIALALGGAFALNASAQITHIMSDFTLALPVLIGLQVLNMGFLMAVPLWAHRHPVSPLDGLLPEQQVRRWDPLALVGAVMVPVIAVVGWSTRDEEPWRLGVVVAALAIVALLGAARQAALSAETRRLYAELETVAEERRLLLAGTLRALEHDRHRMAAELHVQAVESFVAMGALVQTAYGTLPPDSALAVKEALAHLQHDLGNRADSLRRLTAAMRPPTFDTTPAEHAGTDRPGADDRGSAGEPVSDGALAVALRAAAGEVVDPRSSCTVEIQVDPDLDLDWSATTIVYRIVQEAVRNAARHGRAATIQVAVREDHGRIDVRVVDDGIGFDPSAPPNGSGVAGMQLLAQLGNGALLMSSKPGAGTTVRAVLNGRPGEDGAPEPPAAAPPPAPSSARHLLLVADEADGSGRPPR